MWLLLSFSLISLCTSQDICKGRRTPADFGISSTEFNWVGVPYDFDVPENSLAGYQLGQIQAEHTTSRTEAITYTLGDNSFDFLAVDATTGLLTLIRNITDVVNETSLNAFCSSCFAFSVGTSSYTEVGIGIYVRSDHNYHAPSFNETLYIVSVRENAVPDTVVFAVSASDADSGDEGRVTYSIIDATNGGVHVFSISCDSGNITVNSTLDYERQTAYNMTVVAQDHGPLSQKSSSTHVYVTVLDVNDNIPSFERPVYRANVSEGAPIGTVVLAVSATDLDSGLNSQLTYFISGGIGASAFEINHVSGVIRTKVSLDFETQKAYQLNLIVSDAGFPNLTDIAIVNVYVTGVKGNTSQDVCVDHRTPADFGILNSKMMWVGVPYDFNITNGSLAGYRIGQIQAEHITSNTGTISYAIDDDPHDSLAVNATTGCLILIRNITDVVAKTGLHELCATAIAFSPGTISYTKVGIGIHVRSDHNYHAPSFDETLYIVSVRENAAPDTVVFAVSASDADSGDEGRVTYSITDATNGGVHVFSISTNTGNITVNSRLDYERQIAYNLTVIAQDHGPLSQKSSSTQLYVTVLDVNDNSPSFETPVYRAHVSEGAPIGTVVLAVSATDLDSGLNSQLTYFISGGIGASAFEINHVSGVIRTRVSLDFETQRTYQLNLIVSDSGFPKLIGIAIVNVTVTDVEGNPTQDVCKDCRSLEDSGSPSVFAVVGISVASFVAGLLVAVCILAVRALRRRRLSKQRKDSSAQESKEMITTSIAYELADIGCPETTYATIVDT